MKIFINTFGSRGDVQPYAALGSRLKASGHEVMICTAAPFESFITDQGLDYGYMTDALLRLMDTDAGRGALEDTVGLWGTVKTMIKLAKAAKPINRQMMVDSWKAAEAWQPDMVVFHPKALGAVSIAEKLDLPAVMVNLQPLIAPTRQFPPIGVPELKFGWYNKAAYKLVEMGYRSYAGTVNAVRREQMGLPDFPKSSGMLCDARNRPIPMLHAFSEHLVPRPDDWPPHVKLSGYFFMERAEKWQPPEALAAFLDGGPPPIYVGFGSMAGRNPKRLAETVVRALVSSSKRGIIATGWGGLDAAALPDTILKIDHAPHDWLFDRVSAVLHHGGAGTTAAGLRAGRPTLICPFMGDQPFWGRRVHDRGAGPKPIPIKKLTVKRLVRALDRLDGDNTVRENAARIGALLRAEDGLGNGVASIERIGAVDASGR